MSSSPYPAPALRLPAQPTPSGFLLAIVRARPWLATASGVFGALWLVPGALLPLVVGKAIDVGIAGGDYDALLVLSGLVLLIGLAQAVFGTFLTFAGHGMWMHGSSTAQRTVAQHTAHLGATLREQAGTGDILAFSTSDVNHCGNLFEVGARLVGAVVAFVAVGVALLTLSPLLGLVALVGVPMAVLGIGPLLAPLQRRKQAQREELSGVNSLGGDIVSGLRVLRGVGGERQFLGRFRTASQRVRRAGIDVARSESWLSGAEVLLPGLVTVTITWLGARLAAQGVISAGELVTFYGASAFLVIPVNTATEAATDFASAMVSAKKACALLRLRPRLADPASPVPLPDGVLELYDSEAGITAVAGKLTVIDLGARAEAVAERMARFTDPEPGQRVLVSGIPADRIELAELRRRVVYAHNQDVWFSGILREQVAAPIETAVDVATAIEAADAGDIVEALPLGMDELIGERGREISGGQRQRLNLARALVLDADVLLLDEPTSAVDAHTEARISERVAGLRRGRTTVVFAQSPLWMAVADEVVRPELPEVPPCN